MKKVTLLLFFFSMVAFSQSKPATADINRGMTGDSATYNYISLSSKPSFENMPDDLAVFSEYVQSRFNTSIKPANYKKDKLKVYISFIVEKDGSLSDITILKDPGSGVAEEIKRVVNQSPKWAPGKINNNTVRVRCNAPVEISY